MSKEEEVTGILREKFDPDAIVLVESRVDGTALETSDWDVFLFCGERRAGVEIIQDGLKIDVNFFAWPGEDGYFDTGFGPVYPSKVLYDRSRGRLEKILENTKTARQKGPLELQVEVSTLRVRALERCVEKILKYELRPDIQFSFKGRFYNLFLLAWFEQRNQWPPAPAQAVDVLKKENPETHAWLESLAISEGAESGLIAERLRKIAIEV